MNSNTFMDGKYANAPGLLLDGVPRTIGQAKMLSQFSQVDFVINFFNKTEVLVQKIAGRRVCPKCAKNFNVADVHTDCGYHMEPLLPNGDDPTLCDGDHEATKLITRPDDIESVVLERLQLYEDQTLPILEYYKESPLTHVIDFEAKNGKKDYPELRTMLYNSLNEEMIVTTNPSFEKHTL
jgi:adenylate kinase